MVINFNGGGGMTPAQVQEMIDAALDFTTGIINLSTATADQVKTAFGDPERWLCSINYSGYTYLEQYRSVSITDRITAYFYVIGAESAARKVIHDAIIRAIVTPSTGAVEIDTTPFDYVPDIIYDLDQMNSAQTAIIYERLQNHGLRVFDNRFSAVWTYNGKQYSSIGLGVTLPNATIIGTSWAGVGTNSDIWYCSATITPDGGVTYHEYTSNIELTLVQ